MGYIIIGIPSLLLLIGLTVSTGNWVAALLTFVLAVALIIKAVILIAEADNAPS